MLAAVFFAALVHAPLPAHAQYAECTAAGKTADERIKTCTIAIAAETGTRAALAYNFRGVAWHDKYDLDRAIADFDQAVRLNPNSSSAVNNRGIAWQAKGDLDRAIADHTRAIALDTKEDAVGAYRFRSIALRLKGETDRAITDASEAIRLYPDYNAAYVDRGLADQEQRRPRPRGLQSGPLSAGEISKRPAGPSGRTRTAGCARSRCGGAEKRKPAHDRERPARRAGDRQRRLSPAPQLANPANDAADMPGAAQARLRRGRGTESRQARHGGEDPRVRPQARARELALFFYAGHGLQVGGKNYLMPIDAKLERPGDLNFDAVDVAIVLAQMEAEQRVNLVFLDACRDNPLARARRALARRRARRRSARSGGHQSALGTLIAYATQPDNVALDGEGRNSPFTAALLRHIATPGSTSAR